SEAPRRFAEELEHRREGYRSEDVRFVGEESERRSRSDASQPEGNHRGDFGARCGERGSAGEYQGAVMRRGWDRKAIGEVCDIVNGGTPKTGVPEYWNGCNLWITPAEMGKRL